MTAPSALAHSRTHPHRGHDHPAFRVARARRLRPSRAAAMELFRSASARYNIAVTPTGWYGGGARHHFLRPCIKSKPRQSLQFRNISQTTVPGDAVTVTLAQDLVERAAALQQTVVPASTDYLPLLVEAWLIGGTVAEPPPPPPDFSAAAAHPPPAWQSRQWHASAKRCLALQDRLGITRVIRFCECVTLEAPGGHRLALPGGVPAALCHHWPVRRANSTPSSRTNSRTSSAFDAFVNLFQIAAETLLFYHPGRVVAQQNASAPSAKIVATMWLWAVCGDPRLPTRKPWPIWRNGRPPPVMAVGGKQPPRLAARPSPRMLGATQTARPISAMAAWRPASFALRRRLSLAMPYSAPATPAPAPQAAESSTAPVAAVTSAAFGLGFRERKKPHAQAATAPRPRPWLPPVCCRCRETDPNAIVITAPGISRAPATTGQS